MNTPATEPEKLFAADIEWLLKQPKGPERDHLLVVALEALSQLQRTSQSKSVAPRT